MRVARGRAEVRSRGKRASNTCQFKLRTTNRRNTIVGGQLGGSPPHLLRKRKREEGSKNSSGVSTANVCVRQLVSEQHDDLLPMLRQKGQWSRNGKRACSSRGNGKGQVGA
eukprot:scaffold259898_cov27-Tisochrysis_lutea.AAC.4